MAGYTKNFNLKKPSDIEFYSIEDFNENFEKIDQLAVKKGEGIGDLTGGTLVNRPEPGIAGRYYFAQDTGEIYLDTGEEWVLAAASQRELDAHKADNFHHIPYVIATGTNSYAVNIQGITALTEGMSVKVKFTNANTGASTLNINGLGAKPIRKSNGNALSSGNIKAGQICHLVYTGSVFQLLGEGGEYGTAQPNHVLEGITFGTEDGLKVGTMPNRGAINRTITTQGGQIVIPEGYHNGSGIVKAQFANLIAENIKKGVNIGGVTGTYEPTPTLKTVRIGDISVDKDTAGGYTSKTFTKVYGKPIGYRARNGWFSGGRYLYDDSLFYLSSPKDSLSKTLSSPETSNTATIRITDGEVRLTQNSTWSCSLVDLYIFFILD
ncbi:hypothetical protein [Tepidimicrobium xylanilyticum]|uniref:Uncharacterized protein n=1 Tax=Tepidimicrobium xylanilyticum TaxID=1123352 RepID=A0A1H3F0D5_9FIRM|nr:hypothetical protein [Tepidimicrobium xylanilyticum]SDX83461.1 hypothetical protein SAMN05660923_03022 [Tepidimicrobium xylanilyticum]SDX84502.1 hypothetical protein SAMN05660923_03039 [Tepidimicrobium xylanilyticum]SDX87243.1 hypothetical protein SAMN05660923_03087 [Tepidimicrobium xylanilyticum]